MGKIILEFDSVEESHDARIAIDAMRWKMAIWDLDQELRTVVKHDVSMLNGGGQPNELEYDIVDKVREKIREILNGYNLDLND